MSHGASFRHVTVLEMDIDKCTNAYGVAPCTAALAAGSECYNCWKTCQDKANFTKGTKTWSFCTAGADTPADEQIRPYIEKVSFAPTQIDIEKGLSPRGMVTLTLVDEPDSDAEADPYASTRASAAQGTFWSRFLFRNYNYAGREARIRRAYLTGAWNWADFVTENYIIESIKGPDGNGRVQIILKDPVKLADRRQYPEPNDGKLASALTAVATTITLETGDGADYSASGSVRINDEVITYTGNSSDQLTGCSRAQYGTTAAAHDSGDGVQQCVVWTSASVATVLEDLLNAGGIASADIDTTGFASEDASWLGTSYQITACLSEPEKVTKLLEELVSQVGGFMWWSPTEGKIKFKANAPLSPGETVAATLTDEGYVIEGSVKVDVLGDLRTTQRAMFYDIRSATSDLKEKVSYRRADVFIDADAEGANEYNDRRTDLTFSRWFTAANAAGVLAQISRTSRYYRDAPRNITLRVDGKDAALREGDLVDVEIGQIVGTGGAPETTRCRIILRRDEEGQVQLVLRTVRNTTRPGFIAPSGTADYPTDTDYAHISPAAGADFSDGGEPYKVI